MFVIRFAIYFTLSFAIMCIPVGNEQHLFDKLHQLVTPYADKALVTTKKKFSSTKRYSKKFYSNSEPFEKDEVKTNYAAIKKPASASSAQPTDDTYTEEERERLKKALSDE